MKNISSKIIIILSLITVLFLATSCFPARCPEPQIIDYDAGNCCNDLNKNSECDNSEINFKFPGENNEKLTDKELENYSEETNITELTNISSQTEEEEEEMEDTIILIKTSMGDIEVELNQKKAPITVKNFLSYINDKFYDGTIFHRVIDGFMIQGGGFMPDGTQKDTKNPIKLESQNGLKNEKGTIAMARTNIADSATSQFFINLVDNDFLDYKPGNDGYAVFGKVTKGMDIVEKIGKVNTKSSPIADWPVEDVIVESIEVK